MTCGAEPAPEYPVRLVASTVAVTSEPNTLEETPSTTTFIEPADPPGTTCA
jgi:hypothetical protein